ncbi:MAG TPA: FtsH protease activity modulator HflK [Alphaproteobacteria bacterium]|jgi:membrane protease subunit HflK
MDDKRRKNPWGQGPAKGGGNNQGGNRPPWGGGSGGGDMPPDLDDMLRRAQNNLRQVMPGNLGGGRIIALAVGAVAVLWLASGFYTISPGENGVIQRFGAWNSTAVDEGLHYHFPWPVETLTKLNVSEVRRLNIGFVDRSGRGATGGPKQDIPEESLMLTSDANIVDIDLVVHWNVKSAEEFLFNIQDPENTIKKVAESAVREAVGQTPMFSIITTARDSVAQRAREIMVRNLDDYKSGVNISQVLIQQAEVHPDVQDAFQDVQSAKQDAFDVQNRAGAYREDILPRARGQAIKMGQDADAYRQSVVARATGEAERFNAVYDAYLTGEDVTKKRIYIETMEDVLRNAQKIVIDESAGNSGVVPYLPLNELKPAAGAASTEESAQ